MSRKNRRLPSAGMEYSTDSQPIGPDDTVCDRAGNTDQEAAASEDAPCTS